MVCNADKYDTSCEEFFKWTTIDYCPANMVYFSALDVKDDIFNFTVPAPWNKLFRKNFILENGLLFQTIKSSNDLSFVYSALACCSRIAILDETFIHYRVNNTNSLQGSSKKNTFDAFDALNKLKDFLNSRKLFALYEKSFNKLVGDIGVYTLANIPLERFKKEVTSSQLISCLHSLMGEKGTHEIALNTENIMVYGAGQQAVLLIRYMVEFLGVDKTRIKVVVSSMSSSTTTVYKIPIREISKFDESGVVKMFVCASREGSRQAMIANAHKMGYTDIVWFEDVDLLNICRIFSAREI